VGDRVEGEATGQQGSIRFATLAVFIAALFFVGCKSDASCQQEEACHVYGLCTGKLTKCIVGSDADCVQSIRCRNGGLCSVVDGRCRAVEDDDCKRSEACRVEGKCRAVGVGCVR
jgi:hypothetical protein